MKTLTIALLFAGFMAGCASSATKEVDRKVAAEQVTLVPGEVTTKGHDAIMKSTSLTAEQKQKIISILDRVQAENMALKEEANKLKVALFKTLAESGYKADQVAVMKKRIQKNQNKKMELMFSSLEEVQRVMGVAPDKQDRDMNEIFRAMGGSAEI